MFDLTDYVIMPGIDYKNACDAIREKTGKTDGIESGELAAEIRGIELKLQEKTVTPSEETQEVIPDDGYNGMSKVIVESTVSMVQTRKLTVKNTRSQALTVYYADPVSGLVATSSVTINKESVFDVPDGGVILLYSTGAYNPSSTTNYTCEYDGNGVSVKKQTAISRTTSQSFSATDYGYYFIVCVTSANDDAEISLIY